MARSAVDAEGAKTLTASFSRSLDSRLAPEHPLRRLVAELAESLAYELDSIITEKQPPRSTKRPAVVVATMDFAALVVRLGVVGLRIRDFNREIRPFLFPWQSASAFRGFEEFQSEADSLMILRTLTEELFTPTAEWIASDRTLR